MNGNLVYLIKYAEQQGKAKQKFEDFLESHGEFFDEVQTKHQEDAFLEKYNSPDKLSDLFFRLRWMQEKLYELYADFESNVSLRDLES